MTLGRLAATDTHLYPGARLRWLHARAVPRAGAQVLLEFSDGRSSAATIEAAGADGLVLSVQPYATARGAAIAAKRWRVAAENADGVLKVRARLP